MIAINPEYTTPVFIAKVVDFVLFVGGIYFVYTKYGKQALVAHQEAQNRAVEEAVANREHSQASLAAAAASIEQAKADAVRMVEVGRSQAARLIEDERKAAVEHAQRIAAHAAGELRRERYRVRRELLEETVEQAHAQAQVLAKRELSPARQEELVEGVIAGLERAHG
ncbi:MAG: hypothetical protein DLM53_02360 [Candidatus Eremiobacter antarcticus]|nr:hypothetical protein [Candidatus Eremiobacteraeota bacterium]MBC5808251.1 hypothetical protein [Candidatus Eremiobacteraeota bacterium]PZR63634.1 MAG: hypothetical protein DLM53_02360 [Candidatus Eremiobacter sp. RRmetagenome_bin22]